MTKKYEGLLDNARFRVTVEHKERSCMGMFQLHLKDGKLVAICPDCGPIRIRYVDDSHSSTGTD